MTLIYAHRGASAAAGDNTKAAFELAVEMGADGIELDVRRTADRQLAIVHDPWVSDGRLVSQLAAAELPDGVLLLDAALAACGDSPVNVEIKNSVKQPGHADAEDFATQVCEILLDQGDDTRWLLSSFDFETVAAVRSLFPTLRTALLVGSFRDGDINRASQAGFDAVNPEHVYVSARTIDRAHARGLEVWTWTVDDDDRLAQLIGWGVDGIFTNYPDRAIRLRDHLGTPN